MRRFIFGGLILMMLMVVSGCSSGDKIPPEVGEYSAEWVMANKDYSNTRATGDSAIDSQNVGSLGVSWTFDFPMVGEWGAAATNPIIAGGVVYL